MPKGTIKADVMLSLDGWIGEDVPPEIQLTGNEDDLQTATTVVGTIEVSATRLYSILDAQKRGGRLPLFRMVVIDLDMEKKADELKRLQEEKEKQAELDMKPPKSADDYTPAEKKKMKKDLAAVKKNIANEAYQGGESPQGILVQPDLRC